MKLLKLISNLKCRSSSETSSDIDPKDVSNNNNNNKNNDALIANTRVYAAADYYQLAKLKELALQKFRKASTMPVQAGFAEVITLVYESTSDEAHELRSVLCSMTVKNASRLVEENDFTTVAARIPDFIQELLPKLIQSNQLICEKSAKIYEDLRIDFHNSKEIAHWHQTLNKIMPCKRCQEHTNSYLRHQKVERKRFLCLKHRNIKLQDVTNTIADLS